MAVAQHESPQEPASVSAPGGPPEGIDPAELAVALDATADCVFVFEPRNFIFSYVNKGATEQLGYTREELRRMSPLNIKPQFSRAAFERMVRPLQRDPGRVHRFTTVHRHRDGHDIPVAVALRFVPRLGDIGRFVAVVTDVTSLSETEAEIRRLKTQLELSLSAAQQGTWDLHLDTGEALFNDTWYTMLGYEPRELPMSFETWTSLMHPDDQEKARGALESHLRGVTERFRAETRMRTKAGTWKWILTLGRVVESDAGGVPLRVSGMHLDIDTSKRAESLLRQQNRTLADRNEQLDQFARVAAHDLRAPLRSIAGNAELAMLSGSAEKRGRHLARILEGARRMSALLDGLSAYSRVGRAELRPGRVDLDGLVADVLADLESDIRDRGAEVASRGLGTATADERMLRQVLLNLIGNGLKFVRDRRPVIRVERFDEDGFVCVCVCDNGIGISESDLAAIFEPFKRLHTASEFEGSGVGLSVCKRVIERHGGRIWVESTPGEGSAFRFTLPRHEGDLPAATVGGCGCRGCGR